MTLARFVRIVGQRARSIWQPRYRDREVSSELAFHFEALVREGIADGLSPEQARLAAYKTLGNTAVLEEECRDQRHVRWFHDFQQDVSYGWRVLRRQPAFSSAAIASLALGIGANAAMLGVIDAVLVRRLPFPDADRLVIIRAARAEHPDQLTGVTIGDFLDWSDRQHSFQSLGLSMPWPADIGVEADGTPAERLLGQLISPEVFETLGAQATLGRTFGRDEDQRGDASREVVISDGLWRRRFAADPGIVGKTIHLDQVDRVVIGVMPAAFQYRDARIEFWLPYTVNRRPGQNPSRLFGIVGRLKPGVTLDDARAEFRTIDAQLAVDSPDRHAGWTSQLSTLREAMYGWTLKPLFTVQVAVVLLLVIACVNLAALLLIRGAARGPEIRLRLALGAGQGRIARQLLAEGLMLSVAGGVVGIIVASLGLRGIASAMTPPVGLPRMPDLVLDAGVLAATIGLVVTSVLAFALVPALRSSRVGVMAGSESNPLALRPVRSTGTLVAAELALAVILLVGAGLLTRSFVLLTSRDLGFDPSGLVAFDYRAPGGLPRQIGEYQGFQYFEMNPGPPRTIERIFDRLRQLPEVDAVAGSSHPLLDSATTAIVPVASSAGTEVTYEIVTPGFFATLRATRLRGRDFDDRDRSTSQWVAIVNESAARLLWPQQEAIGQQLSLDIVPEERPREIVGVVGDILLQRAQTGAVPVVYASFLQQPSRYRAPWSGMLSQMNFLVRRKSGPIDVIPLARRAVAEIEPTRPLANVAFIDDLSPLMRDRQSYAAAMSAFAVVAVLLAAMGVYGVIARAVTERAREIGIRRALGAGSSDVVTFLSRRMIWLLTAGIAMGLLTALALTRLITSQLWGVSPGDPLTYVGAAVVVVVAAATASVVPTRRALALDPGVVLKNE
jgi:predicted permease